MPELPEVEITCRGLAPVLSGRTIVSMHNNWANTLPSPRERYRLLKNRTIRSISRRGKYIVMHLDGGLYLVVHLKMSGRLYVYPRKDAPKKHVHTSFKLDNDTDLVFQDPRKFGRVYCTTDLDEITGHLGTEPLDDSFTLALFNRLIDGRRGVLKAFLLNQQRIAGIGNIYADESCFRARVRPDRSVDSLSRPEAGRLHKAIIYCLNHGIVNKGADLGDQVYRGGEFQNHFNVYGRTGQPCRKCGQPIKRIIVAARSTHFCEKCQA